MNEKLSCRPCGERQGLQALVAVGMRTYYRAASSAHSGVDPCSRLSSSSAQLKLRFIFFIAFPQGSEWGHDHQDARGERGGRGCGGCRLLSGDGASSAPARGRKGDHCGEAGWGERMAGEAFGEGEGLRVGALVLGEAFGEGEGLRVGVGERGEGLGEVGVPGGQHRRGSAAPHCSSWYWVWGRGCMSVRESVALEPQGSCSETAMKSKLLATTGRRGRQGSGTASATRAQALEAKLLHQ